MQIKEMSILSFIRKSCFVCFSVPNSSAGTIIDFEEKFLPAQSLFGTARLLLSDQFIHLHIYNLKKHPISTNIRTKEV